MSLNNRDRISKGFDLLSEGLNDLVDEIMTDAKGADWHLTWAAEDAARRDTPARAISKVDVQTQLRAITEKGVLFKATLSRAQVSYAQELRETRNRWAHSAPFSTDETLRALDTMCLLLTAAGSTHSANDVRKLHADLQAQVYADKARHTATAAAIRATKTTDNLSDAVHTGLAPWRDVIRPHDDVASGNLNQSEFAADLHQVHHGLAAAAEYTDPTKFFARTYLTEGLRDLLGRCLRRMNGDRNASPVVNLQTNFGGGKTHSMLALYHLCSGTTADRYPQELQDLIVEHGNPALEGWRVRRACLVGTMIDPGSPDIKEDGTEVHTLWGELAWQLGGRAAYNAIADADRNGTSPGAALRDVIAGHSPALILIDEWVAYARQLVGKDHLPSGSFDTQFTFAQLLTEVVKSLPGVMLVVSVPASDRGHAGTDIEVGGNNGHQALERLQNVMRRVADQWQPSKRDESFEIVRRRLFHTVDADGYTKISAVAKRFSQLYQANPAQFPSGCTDPSYERRIRSSYPLHPELLDRLYEDWSTLERFQRTRGVLKLVSSMVHELWQAGDANALIMPGTVPLATRDVNADLTQYLEDQWKPIIDSDIDGPDSTAYAIDKERPHLGERLLTRRLARTIFMGAAPRLKTGSKGLDKQYLWLGAAMPDDKLGDYGAALEHMSQRSTHFYEEQGRYWFDTSPSVAKTAQEHAERLREHPDVVWAHLAELLRHDAKRPGSFDRVHVCPEGSSDVPDLDTTRLVLVPPHLCHSRGDGPDSELMSWVRGVIEGRGSAQRTHRNTLIFLAMEKAPGERLCDAVRSHLGWRQIRDGRTYDDLTGQQRKTVDAKVSESADTVTDRLRDAYVRVVFPRQDDPTQAFTLEDETIGSDTTKSLAERVDVKLTRAGEMIPNYGPALLGAQINNGDLRGAWLDRDHLSVGELWGYYTRYPYLPRLIRREVMDQTIRDAAISIFVNGERFALADGVDDTGRYRSLIVPPNGDASIHVTDNTLLVKWTVAEEQVRADQAARAAASVEVEALTANSSKSPDAVEPLAPTVDIVRLDPGRAPRVNIPELPQRFYGSVTLNGMTFQKDFGEIAREVIQHVQRSGAEFTITLDIHASKESGFTEDETRLIRENAQVLKFTSAGFEGS